MIIIVTLLCILSYKNHPLLLCSSFSLSIRPNLLSIMINHFFFAWPWNYILCWVKIWINVCRLSVPLFNSFGQNSSLLFWTPLIMLGWKIVHLITYWFDFLFFFFSGGSNWSNFSYCWCFLSGRIIVNTNCISDCGSNLLINDRLSWKRLWSPVLLLVIRSIELNFISEAVNSTCSVTLFP
jgi:hypothetical protein